MAFGLSHRRVTMYAIGLVCCLAAAETGLSAIASAQTETSAADAVPAAGSPAVGSQTVGVAQPGEVVPVIEAPAAALEPAAGSAAADPAASGDAVVNAPAAEPAPAVPDEEADAEPVLTIDPVLEGISASRPLLRGLDKLLGRPAIAARPERPGSLGDPELDSFADASALKLEPPVAPDDPVWRARSRPPVSLTGAAATPEVHGEAGLRGFLARAGGDAGPQVIVETR